MANLGQALGGLMVGAGASLSGENTTAALSGYYKYTNDMIGQAKWASVIKQAKAQGLKPNTQEFYNFIIDNNPPKNVSDLVALQKMAENYSDDKKLDAFIKRAGAASKLPPKARADIESSMGMEKGYLTSASEREKERKNIPTTTEKYIADKLGYPPGTRLNPDEIKAIEKDAAMVYRGPAVFTLGSMDMNNFLSGKSVNKKGQELKDALDAVLESRKSMQSETGQDSQQSQVDVFPLDGASSPKPTSTPQPVSAPMPQQQQEYAVKREAAMQELNTTKKISPQNLAYFSPGEIYQSMQEGYITKEEVAAAIGSGMLSPDIAAQLLLFSDNNKKKK